MRGLNIDINRSLSAQSSNSETGFVESGLKIVGHFHSLASVSDEVSKQGSDDIQNLDSKAYTSGKFDTVSHQVGPSCGDPSARIPPDHLHKLEFNDDHNSNLLKRLSSDVDKYIIGNSSGKSLSNQMIADTKCDEKNPDKKQKNISVMNIPLLNSSNTLSRERSADRFFLLGTSKPQGESVCAFQGTILQDTTNLGKSLYEGTKIDPNKEKGKERASQTANSKSFSNGQNDSSESVDSISSKRLLSLGKRYSCFDIGSNSGSSKRFKRLNDEVSFSRPVVHPGRSFFNWISSVANGIPRNAPRETSLPIVPKPSIDGRMADSLTPLPHEEDIPDGHTGFGSFVKALYRPSLEKAQEALTTKYGVCHTNMDQSNERRDHVGHDRGNSKLLQPIPLSMLRANSCQLGDFSPENVRNSTSSHSPFLGTSLHVCHEQRNWWSTSSSTQNCSFLVPSKSSSSRFSSGGSEFLGSSWITRLCSKPVKKVLIHLDQDKRSAAERLTYERNCAPQIQNIDHHREGNHMPLLGHQNDDPKNQEHTSPTVSLFPKGDYGDQKLKCKLNPIVPSPVIRKLEPITSLFAKRVDALRQIKPSRVPNVEESNLMCFFCGTTGHDMTICPEITDSDDDLLRNIGSWNWPSESSRICIRCLRLNHWAVACPYMPARSKRPSGSVFGNTSQFTK